MRYYVTDNDSWLKIEKDKIGIKKRKRSLCFWSVYIYINDQLYYFSLSFTDWVIVYIPNNISAYLKKINKRKGEKERKRQMILAKPASKRVTLIWWHIIKRSTSILRNFHHFSPPFPQPFHHRSWFIFDESANIRERRTITHAPHKHAIGAEFVECEVSTCILDTFTCGHTRISYMRARVCVYALREYLRDAEASMLTAFGRWKTVGMP